MIFSNSHFGQILVTYRLLTTGICLFAECQIFCQVFFSSTRQKSSVKPLRSVKYFAEYSLPSVKWSLPSLRYSAKERDSGSDLRGI
jgi:hypothetical protein